MNTALKNPTLVLLLKLLYFLARLTNNRRSKKCSFGLATTLSLENIFFRFQNNLFFLVCSCRCFFFLCFAVPSIWMLINLSFVGKLSHPLPATHLSIIQFSLKKTSHSTFHSKHRHETSHCNFHSKHRNKTSQLLLTSSTIKLIRHWSTQVLIQGEAPWGFFWSWGCEHFFGSVHLFRGLSHVY